MSFGGKENSGREQGAPSLRLLSDFPSEMSGSCVNLRAQWWRGLGLEGGFYGNAGNVDQHDGGIFRVQTMTIAGEIQYKYPPGSTSGVGIRTLEPLRLPGAGNCYTRYND